MRISFDTDEEARLRRFAEALGKDRAKAAELGTTLAPVALAVLLDWVLDDNRPDTGGQLAERWIGQLQEALFPGEPPDATRLFERYAVAMTRAEAVARALRAKSRAQWRVRARAELKSAIDAELAWAKATASKTETTAVTLSRAALDEFRTLYESSFPKPPQTQPKRVGGFGQRTQLGLSTEVILTIASVLTKEAPK